MGRPESDSGIKDKERRMDRKKRKGGLVFIITV